MNKKMLEAIINQKGRKLKKCANPPLEIKGPYPP